MLTCVDCGSGDTKVKTLNRLYKFNSRIQLAINNDGNVLQVDGIDYQIGIGQDDISMDKSSSQVNQLCILKAIAENIVDAEEITLMLDIPLVHYYNLEYREEFKESIPRNKVVYYNGVKKTINISKLDACPQGLTSLYAYDHKQYENRIVAVLDIGSYTIDGCLVENLKPIKESMFSINLGTIMLENKVKTALNQEFMLNIQNYQMSYIIKNGLDYIPKANNIIANVIEEYFSQIKREMIDKRWSIETVDILGLGGGAIILQDSLDIHFRYIQSKNPVYDNVLGLWNLGKTL